MTKTTETKTTEIERIADRLEAMAAQWARDVDRIVRLECQLVELRRDRDAGAPPRTPIRPQGERFTMPPQTDGHTEEARVRALIREHAEAIVGPPDDSQGGDMLARERLRIARRGIWPGVPPTEAHRDLYERAFRLGLIESPERVICPPPVGPVHPIA